MKLSRKNAREILQRQKTSSGYKKIKRQHSICLGIFLVVVVLFCAFFSAIPVSDFRIFSDFFAVGGILVFCFANWKIHHPSVYLGKITGKTNRTIRGILLDTQYIVSTEKCNIVAHSLNGQEYNKGDEVYVVSELTNFIAEEKNTNEEKNS